MTQREYAAAHDARRDRFRAHDDDATDGLGARRGGSALMAAKKAAKPTTKATRGNVANLKPLSRDDPRRNKTIPGPGRPSDEFKRRMAAIASGDAQLKALEAIAKDRKHPDFLKALAFAADRGYGKPAQSVDVTSGGNELQRFTLGIATA